MKEITTSKKSLLVSMAFKYGIEPEKFAATVKATVMPPNATNEQLAAFLMVANKYDLDPIAREIHAFPAKNGGIQAFLGIDGWMNLAQRRAEFDGIEFDTREDSVTCRVYRKDRSRPVEITEFLDECRRNTEPWRSHPRRMLRHKAAIQAIRYAFGFSGIFDEDEAEVIARGVVVDPAEDTAEADYAEITDSVKQHQEAPLEPESEAEEVPKNEEQESAPQIDSWPQEREDGSLVDADDVPWKEEFHSGSKNCTEAGLWRMRRGYDREAYESWLADIRKPIQDDDAQREVPNDNAVVFDVPWFDKMMAEAQTQDHLVELEEVLRTCQAEKSLVQEDVITLQQKINRRFHELGGQEKIL